MKKQRISGNYTYKKDIGKVRQTQEDESMVLTNDYGDVLMIVADGMGGLNRGDYAARQLIYSFENAFKPNKRFWSWYSIYRFIYKNLKAVNDELYEISERNNEFGLLGTTVVIAILHKNKLYLASCGDSRCYLLSKDSFKQINEDETYAAYLYNSGQIQEDEVKSHPKRHVLTNAIGIFPSLSFDFKVLPYNKETILLCSDGLYNSVNGPDIENILRTDDDIEDKAETLLSVANFNGGSDNISLALWECDDD